ncbi:MAG: prepilin-type N-terminal cleavage/methylation domain-containing protein [Deltaproteobacteria bacterium]|jgi:type IV pilus assembly protein PilW|nr:prepilin-type N-terminal cleavage/methylation domain-containing protein [Deltaproteobacteria bacterium]
MITLKRNLGFTLIELLVAMAISAVVMTAVYSTYQSQQKSYAVQEEVAAMQQDLRAAMFYMSNQIREAGCNPTQTDINRPGIVTADVDEINFTADITGGSNGNADGDTSDSYENVTYSLYTSDGIQKLGVKSTATATNQPVIENVDTLNFVYLDGNGIVTTTLPNIRSVEVAIVVRASREDRDYTNGNEYRNQQGDVILGAQNDHFRRKILNMRIACRNLGLIVGTL